MDGTIWAIRNRWWCRGRGGAEGEGIRIGRGGLWLQLSSESICVGKPKILIVIVWRLEKEEKTIRNVVMIFDSSDRNNDWKKRVGRVEERVKGVKG
jgi:hypothetical protein